jgi:RNA polymerase sigma-70 factor (ECF subfamily)
VSEALDFPAFFRATAGPLAAYVRRLGANAAMAEDVAQDAFQALVASGAMTWEAPRAKAYLFRCATNAWIDACRKHAREVAWDTVPEPADPRTRDAPDDITASPAWRSLTARQRQLLWLAYAEEFPHREIARICGIAEGSVRVLLSRAREAFRAAEQGDRHA